MSSLRGCHERFLEGFFELWRLEVLVRLAKNVSGYYISREGSECAIESKDTTIGHILVDLAAESAELLLNDRLEVRDALSGEEGQKRRLADLVKIVIGRGEDGARNVLSIDEEVVFVHPTRTVQCGPVV
jgi:hypothetical protein